MKPTRWFSATLFFASSIALAGCYTHLATNDQGYYVYHAPRPVYSDTIRPHSANVTLAEKPLIVYDTTMHGDTMFIDERQVQPAAQAENVAPDGGTDGTVINNYYGSGSYWDDYWGPSWGFSIGVGWPYYHSLWPYYSYSWYEPFGYFGAYPPFFDYYSPYYAGFYSPYYDGYYGQGYYGHGYYGHGFHDHGFDNDFGGYANNGYGLNVRPGRVGGEYRAGSLTSPAARPGSSIGLAPRSNLSSASVTSTNLTRATNSSFAETNAADELRASADRNAPMHVVAPDASAAVARGQSAEAVRAETPTNATSTNVITTRASASNGFANTSARPVVVRRMDGQTMTTSTASSQAGRPMIVVRRSAGNSSRGYNSSSPGYNSSSRDYNSSSRGYSAPARSYSAPAARSYSAPAARSPGGEGGGSYSAPAQSSGGGESSSGRASGGESSGGGGGERSSGGGGGSERSGGGGGGGRR